MGNNVWFNSNPYRSDVSHIPSTHYESQNLYERHVVFIYGSIAHKCDLFKKSLLDLVEIDQIGNPSLPKCGGRDVYYKGRYLSSGIAFKNDILSDTDEIALHMINHLFRPVFTDACNGSDEPDVELDLVESYLRNSTKEVVNAFTDGEQVLVKAVASPEEGSYPYDLNTIDTGVPNDLYYEIKNLSDGIVAIIVYDGFLDYIFKNHQMKNFIKHLVIKLHEFMAIQEIAQLALFRTYIKTL